MWCWGRNDNGTLGHAASENNGDIEVGAALYQYVLTKIAAINGAIDLITGETSCAVRASGEVWCWGSNRGNLLVLERGDDAQRPKPRVIPNIAGAKYDTGVLGHVPGTRGDMLVNGQTINFVPTRVPGLP